MASTPQRRRTDGKLAFRVSRSTESDNPFGVDGEPGGVLDVRGPAAQGLEPISAIIPRTDAARLLEVNPLIEMANRAMLDYQSQAAEYNRQVIRELELEAQRPTIRQAVVARIMADGKTAATNADKLAACDTDYLTHLAQMRDVVEAKNMAHAFMVSAQMQQQNALAGIRALLGGLY